jgi:Fe-S cluster biogenesis protein NfuA
VKQEIRMNSRFIKNLFQISFNVFRTNSNTNASLFSIRLLYNTNKYASNIKNINIQNKVIFPSTQFIKNNHSTFVVLNFKSVRNMFVQTQSTPNPDSIKFFPGKEVMGSGKSMDFANSKEAQKSPFAKKLFRIEGINHVFFGPDFVSINKEEDANWQQIKPFVFSSFMEFYDSKQPIIDENFKEPEVTSNSINSDDDEVVLMIKELLDTRIRPIVMEDGGDIHFKKFKNGIVYLKMQGSCSGCPSSTMTLRNGIENMLMHYIPEVSGVRPSDDLDEGDPLEKVSDDQFKKVEEKLAQHQT